MSGQSPTPGSRCWRAPWRRVASCLWPTAWRFLTFGQRTRTHGRLAGSGRSPRSLDGSVPGRPAGMALSREFGDRPTGRRHRFQRAVTGFVTPLVTVIGHSNRELSPYCHTVTSLSLKLVEKLEREEGERRGV